MHTAAALDGGGVLAWGWALKGQLGLPDPDQRFHRPVAAAAAAEDQLLPAPVLSCLPLGRGPALALPAVRAVAAGARHTALLTADGRVWTCGDSRFGALGYGGDAGGDGPDGPGGWGGPQRQFRQVCCARGVLAKPCEHL